MTGDTKALLTAWVLVLASFLPMPKPAYCFILGGVAALMLAKVLGCYSGRNPDPVEGTKEKTWQR